MSGVGVGVGESTVGGAIVSGVRARGVHERFGRYNMRLPGIDLLGSQPSRDAG